MSGHFDLKDVQDPKSVAKAQLANSNNPRGALSTSSSKSDIPQQSLTTYGLSDALQGIALYKPSGITYDAFNDQTSKELQSLGTEPLFRMRDDKLNPYDVFPNDPDPSKVGQVNLDGTTTGTAAGEGEVVPVGDPTAYGMTYPFANRRSMSSGFGPRQGGFHAGLDLQAALNDKVLAVKAGKASKHTQPGGVGWGNYVDIDHGDGLLTRYAHLNSFVFDDTKDVQAGEVIGLAGSTGRSTGEHLHIEVVVNGKAVNPVPYIGQQ